MLNKENKSLILKYCDFSIFMPKMALMILAIFALSGCSTLGTNSSDDSYFSEVEAAFVQETRSLNTSIIRNAPGLNQEGPDNIVKNYTDEQLVEEGYKLCESFTLGATIKDIIASSPDVNNQYANTAIGLGAVYHLCPSYSYLADSFLNG